MEKEKKKKILKFKNKDFSFQIKVIVDKNKIGIMLKVTRKIKHFIIVFRC